MARVYTVPVSEQQLYNLPALAAWLGVSETWVREHLLPQLQPHPLSHPSSPLYFREHILSVLRDKQGQREARESRREVKAALGRRPTLRRVAHGETEKSA